MGVLKECSSFKGVIYASNRGKYKHLSFIREEVHHK